ncbi:tetraspanin 35 isoform X2 [Hypomesus transpacificus]|uniref:tetraspanin 35 isoform X2 n=1 Tax=Hypomesus transpacificus TaxID=137520 RepID=UPI001F081834|nr:tetraspanin 35 isoform X2 [Hypomesus transpacificus]
MGCFAFLKVMMFVFNGIIFVAGAVILGVGIWVKVDSGSILGFIQGIQDAPEGLNQLLNVGYLLIAIGALLLVIGFLGCCGAVRESRCMLLLAEDLISKLGTQAVDSIKKDYGQNPDVTGLWNVTMDTLKCCGFYNSSDFDGSPFHKPDSQYPPQCCQDTTRPCGSADATVTGCFPKFQKLIDENSAVIAGVALGIAALEILAMVFSMTLYCKIGSKIN